MAAHAHDPPRTPAAHALTRLLSGPAGAAGGPGGSASAAAAEPVVLAERPEVTVVRVGSVVAKAHAAGTDAEALGVRLRVARDPALDGILLAPLPPGDVTRMRDGRAATMWPYGTPVDPDDAGAVPWEAAGRLLAALHAVPLPLAGAGAIPAMGGAVRTARVVGRIRALAGHAAARRAVAGVWEGLPAWCRGEAEATTAGSALCHGDFHLGQLVRQPGPGPSGPWRLIDVDDLGLGDPVWDLARPAAWYAAGLLPEADWRRLLGAYRPDWDPWPRLDAPARTLTAHFAARSLLRADAAGRALTGEEEAFVDACARIIRIPGTPEGGSV
ncbi:phosphotransferase [Streptomyces sp. 6N223]|uniref:phosphotransferase n=1 Tax=Streptomyces sp. 6N223 TaxID=3457412 RepID=UPI003FCF260F